MRTTAIGALMLSAVLSGPALSQTAYSPLNNQRSVHNACWQALGIPPSSSYPTNPRHQRDLEACKAAGGPDAYRRRGGTVLSTPSGEARGRTCSQLVQECVSHNTRVGAPTDRCETYRASCMRTGVYEDRGRRITGVVRR